MFKTLKYAALALALVAAPMAHGQACTGSSDAAIVANATAVDGVAETCGYSCAFASDASSCIASCMVSKAGLSTGCAKCFGDDGSCTKSNCALSCLNPKSSGCISCSNQHCLSAFQACAGTSTTKSFIIMDTGACANSADEAALVDKATTTANLKTCGSKCKADSSCMVSCMESATGVSANCASCFGGFSTCTASKCLFQCIADPSSATCQDCATKNCEPSLDSCTGITPPAKPLAVLGGCSAADQAKLQSKATNTANLEACGAKCKADSSCMETCMESKAGVSASCATCFGGFSTCAASKCLLQCIADPSSASCQSCTTQNCEPALDACTGVTPHAEPLVVLESGSCANAADEAKLVDKATTTANLKACGTQCKADSSCMVTCMENKTGVSATCASCFGGFSSCTASKCLFQCIADPSSATCQDCATKNCEPALDACTGITPQQ